MGCGFPHLTEHCSKGIAPHPTLFMFNKQKFISFYINTPNETNASMCWDAVNTALIKIGIYSDLTMLGAMATIRVECGKSFKPIEEKYIEQGKAFVGAQYEGRINLGNNQVGDGNLFRGRGLIQLTGRANYSEYKRKTGLDLINSPDLLLDLNSSAQILAQYFKDRGVHVVCNNKNWMEARRLVNGGTNGLVDFLNVVNQYLKAD